MLAAIRTRVQRLLRRRGLDPADSKDAPADPLAEASPALAALASASVQGPRRARPARRRAGPPAWSRTRCALGDVPPRQAYLDGFDLHADVAVPAGDRARLEQLCRYVLRPALAQERLSLTPDGQVLVTLKAEWHDGGRPTSCSGPWNCSRSSRR